MRGFDSLRDFLAEFGEEFGNDAVAGEPLAVFGFKEFFFNEAARVDEEIAGPGKSFLHAGGFGVEHAECADGIGIGVCQQRIFDLVAIAKEFQNFFIVIADGGKFDALLFEALRCVLQLDQLRFAEGSPIGGTKKKEHGAVGTF
jgi:hypothetical protein